MIERRLCTYKITSLETTKPPIHGGFEKFLGLHQTLGTLMVMVLQAVFVPNHLTIQLIHQLIHGCVHVFMCTLGEHIATFDVDIALCFLTALFLSLVLNAKQHLHINHLIEMSGDAV
jgi:hypothetical protein